MRHEQLHVAEYGLTHLRLASNKKDIGKRCRP